MSTEESEDEQTLADGDGEKYERGPMVARGGMGAILSARDRNVRREVAAHGTRGR